MNKKSLIINILFIMFITLILNINTEVHALEGLYMLEDCSIISPSLQKILDYVYGAIRIAVPILVLVLVTIDIVGAVGSGKEEDMKKATSKAIKRVIIGVVIILIPTLLDFLFSVVPITGTCGIGG